MLWLIELFRKGIELLSNRAMVFVILNWVFFSSILMGSLLVQVERVTTPISVELKSFWEAASLVGRVFVFNLFVSSFMVVTLPGIAFFALSPLLLFVKGTLWGSSLANMPSWRVLVILPTLILEGEAYVLAGVAGVNLGLSWLRPWWLYEGDIPRKEAFLKAWNECSHIYSWVTMILFLAAVMEVATIIFS